MNKYSCTTSTVGSIHFVTLIAEDEQQAKEMAAARGEGRPAARVERAGSGGRCRGAGANHRERQPGSMSFGGIVRLPPPRKTSAAVVHRAEPRPSISPRGVAAPAERD